MVSMGGVLPCMALSMGLALYVLRRVEGRPFHLPGELPVILCAALGGVLGSIIGRRCRRRRCPRQDNQLATT